jgi:hypothetical protein
LARIEDSLKNEGEHYTIESLFNDDPDPLLATGCRAIVLQHDKASASLFQRLSCKSDTLGLPEFLDQLERAGIIGIGIGANPRRGIYQTKGWNIWTNKLLSPIKMKPNDVIYILMHRFNTYRAGYNRLISEYPYLKRLHRHLAILIVVPDHTHT